MLNLEPVDLQCTGDGIDDSQWQCEAEASRRELACLGFCGVLD
jgi:hypothetical protein